MSQRSELIQTIQDIENGLAMNPTGEILERLTSRLLRAKSKLAELDEKKSDAQPTRKTGQLPQKPELEEWAKQIESEAPQPRPSAQSSSEPRPQERQPGLLEKVINLVAPPSAPEQVIEIEIEIDGKMVVEQYSIGVLRDKARTWFTQTAESAAINGKGKLEKSLQYRRLCAVVPNWEQFYGYKPKVQDLHRRHNLHGESVKNAAVRLLQILTQ